MVSNNWNDKKAADIVEKSGNSANDQDLALRVYSSRLIGADHNLVLHGGGNTSCKLTVKDIFGKPVEVIHIKGSGIDLEQIDAASMPAVKLEPLRQLRQLDSLSDADMVNIMRQNMLDSTGPNPSVEILLHAYLPHKFIDHTHATAMLVLADLPDPQAAVKEIYGDKIAIVPFAKPGFALARTAAEIYEKNPQVEGLLLLNHGHFAFGDTARQSYDRLIEQTNMAESWIAKHMSDQAKPVAISTDNSSTANILPMLRGILGNRNAEFTGNRDQPMPVMDWRNNDLVMQFLARNDIANLARRGLATPDYVIRTKNYPLFISRKMQIEGRAAIERAVDAYITDYRAYFDRNAPRFDDEKILLQPSPNFAWIEDIGLVGFGADARAATITADLAEQNIEVMIKGEACGGYQPVGEHDLFDMEYWSLEQAKLGKAKPPKLTGNIVMITGGGGAIGMATARSFMARGANIFIVDLEEKALARALEELGPNHGGIAMDITRKGAAEEAVNACISRFGGLDILVSNAGAAWGGAVVELDEAVFRKSFELNFFSHYAFSKAATTVFAKQGRGGQILFNVSKQAVNPGKNFGAYGMPKATTFFLLRQLALELGSSGIRVNGINADRIRSGLLDDAFIAERSKARGIDEETYMAGNLLKREVEARHVGDAFVALALSERTTAHLITVDGGNIEAALR